MRNQKLADALAILKYFHARRYGSVVGQFEFGTAERVMDTEFHSIAIDTLDRKQISPISRARW